MAKQNFIIEAGTNLVKKTKKSTDTSGTGHKTSTGLSGTGGAVASVGAGSSNANYTRDSEGKWYDAKTGEPLGTGGTNSSWGERQGTMASVGSGARGTSTDFGTHQSDLDKFTKAQRQAAVDQLKAARTKALANLDVQEQNIKPMYENARNQTSAASQQGARNFAEYLANRGLTNSGAAAQGEVNRLSTLNNNLGNLATQEANAYRDIANQRTAIENDYAANLANANNAITQNYYNNLLNYNEQQRQYVQNLQNQALGQYAGDYQAYKNSLLAQGYSPNSLEVLSVDAARGNKINNANANAFTYSNALNNITSGNWSYNDLLATGMTNEQATKLFNDTRAAAELKQQQELEQLLYDRNQDTIKNDLNYEKYLLDKLKTEADIRNINSQITKRSSSGSSGNNSSNSSLDKVIENWIKQGKSNEEIQLLLNG